MLETVSDGMEQEPHAEQKTKNLVYLRQKHTRQPSQERLRQLQGRLDGGDENGNLSDWGTAEVYIIGIMLFGTAVCQLFPEQLISIYSDDAAAIVQYGVTALTIISLGFAISSLSVVTSGVCEALGKGFSSLIISLIRYIVVIIPASVIFSKMWDANGVYVAFVFTEFTAALISALLMKKVLKKG